MSRDGRLMLSRGRRLMRVAGASPEPAGPVRLATVDRWRPWAAAALGVVVLAASGVLVWRGVVRIQASSVRVDDCGMTQIATDTPQGLEPFLVEYRQDVASGRRPLDGAVARCVDALELTSTNHDLRQRLTSAGTPISALVTSDNRIITGLDGGWTSLRLRAAPPSQWLAVGLDPATVVLGGPPGPGPATVPLDQLSGRGIQVGGITDPVAWQVWRAVVGRPAAARPRLDFTSLGVDDLVAALCGGGDGTSPGTGVILPASRLPSCRTVRSRPPAKLVDDAGNLVGAPVLGIPLTAPAADTGPTEQALLAARDFLTWLATRTYPEQPLLGVDAVRALARQTLLTPSTATVPPPHVSVVLDASLSMGRATDRTRFGRPTPWQAALDGLSGWAGSAPPGSGNALTLVLAQEAVHRTQPQVIDLTGPAASDPGRSPAARLEPVVPAGRTGLHQALTVTREHRSAVGDTTGPIVLLTDAVNVFTEDPALEPDDLSGVTVVVIRAGDGCAAVPGPVRQVAPCRSAPPSAADVAERLTVLLGKERRTP